jgi:hypothetical protein
MLTSILLETNGKRVRATNLPAGADRPSNVKEQAVHLNVALRAKSGHFRI